MLATWLDEKRLSWPRDTELLAQVVEVLENRVAAGRYFEKPTHIDRPWEVSHDRRR